jgi:hypothetical protein
MFQFLRSGAAFLGKLNFFKATTSNPFFEHQIGHFINRRRIDGLYDGFALNIAKQGQFLTQFVGDFVFGTANQDIGTVPLSMVFSPSVAWVWF